MTENTTRQKRILIVDDEATLVFFLKQSLQEVDPNFTIEIASSGEEALNMLTSNDYNLLITDLKMPGISGFTLLEVARSLHSEIKIILMTAFGSRDVRDEAEQLDVDGYLTKPFSTSQLSEMAQNFLTSTTNIVKHAPSIEVSS